MNPSQPAYGVNWATLLPAFTDTPMLSGTTDDGGSRMVTYEDNRQAINAVIKKFGVQKYIHIILQAETVTYS